MIRKALLPLFLYTVLYSFGFAQSNSLNETTKDSIIAQLSRFYESEGVQGMAVSISIDSNIILSEGFGYIDLEKEQEVNPSETLFRIASLSKPITSTGMGVLADQGIIDIDASVYQYVPDFPKKAYDFTLRHLASHTAGIRHYKWLEQENKKELSLQAGMNKFQKSKLKFQPGSNYLYSSYGYNLLGLAMQNVAKQPFEKIISDMVLTPLGMNHTIPDQGKYDDYQVTGFFKKKGKKLREHKPVNIFFKLPSGGYLSTSEDLVRFGNSYAYRTLLSEKTQKEICTRQQLAEKESRYGLGWGVSKDKSKRPFYSHSGGGVGAVSRILVYPEQKYCISILVNTNCDYIRMVNLARKISEEVLDSFDR